MIVAKMKKGTCYYCGKKNTDLPIMSWDGKKYEGACEKCAHIYMDDQYIGMLTRRDYPNIYYGKLKSKDRFGKMLAIYHGPDGEYRPIYDTCEDVRIYDE